MCSILDVFFSQWHHFKLIRVNEPLILLELLAQFIYVEVKARLAKAEKLIVVNFLKLRWVLQILARVARQLFV